MIDRLVGGGGRKICGHMALEWDSTTYSLPEPRAKPEPDRTRQYFQMEIGRSPPDDDIDEMVPSGGAATVIQTAH